MSSCASRADDRVVGIIQARMGSTRLPGKVLMPLAGRSLLAHCIDRTRESRAVDQIVVATTHFPADDPICFEARGAGAEVYRGPSEDVLSRYAGAAAAYRAAIVVRITADNPLTDPMTIRRCVEPVRRAGCEYAMEEGLPHGGAAEAFTRALLDHMDRSAREQPHREHVTLYAKQNAARFRVRLLPVEAARRAPHLRITVDTLEDLERLRAWSSAGLLRFNPFSLADFLDRLATLMCAGDGADRESGRSAVCGRL